jgi:epoxyqueuosine reductase
VSTPPLGLSQRVKGVAHALGFDLAGVARAEPTPETRFLREWLARGYAGEMAWLERRADVRSDPRLLLEGARSVLALGFVYAPDADAAAAAAAGEGAGPELRIARYAGGEDYHDVLLDRVRALEAALPALAGGPVRTRGYVDTGPVLERVFAAHAGLGWIGKNTCLIHPRLGSYVFLAAVVTDLELEPDAREPDHCGSCRACLDACPTGALPEPYVLDATRCISYTTIEARGAIPAALREEHGPWGFGCDLCQEVCPWNQRARREVPPDPLGLRARLAPRPEWRRPALAWVLGLGEEEWRAATRGTALRRARYRGLLRNALVAAGNSADPSLEPLLRRHAEGPDPLLAEHARWALARIAGRRSGGASPSRPPAGAESKKSKGPSPF